MTQVHRTVDSKKPKANGNSETFGTKGRFKRAWKNRPKKAPEESDKTQQSLWIRKALQTPSQHRFARNRSSWSSQAFLAAQSVVDDWSKSEPNTTVAVATGSAKPVARVAAVKP